MTLLQLAFNGVALGAAYALVALGFVFIVNATGAVNFAMGDLVMAGGYAAVGLGSMAALPVIVLLPLVAAIMFVLGIAFALVAYFPLINRPPSTVFISTLLCGIVLQNRLHRTVRAAGARRAAAHQKRHRGDRRDRGQHAGTGHACGSGGPDRAAILSLRADPDRPAAACDRAGPADGAGHRHPRLRADRHHLRRRHRAGRHRRRAARQPVLRLSDRRHPAECVCATSPSSSAAGAALPAP